MNRLMSARRVHHLSLMVLLGGVAIIGAATPASAQFIGYGGGLHPAPATGLFGWLLGQQAFFYQALAGLLRAAKTNGSAYWGLMGVSFIYGIFHAAGPGHGKAVISSYLLANEETWRRGVTLSLAAAVLQSLAAITIVAIAALLIGATASMMGNAVRGIEIVSYSLIILVGARLLWVKGRSFHATLRKIRAASEPAAAVVHSAHDHAHDEHVHEAHAGHSHACASYGHQAHAHAVHAHYGHDHAHHHDHEHHHDHGHDHVHDHDDEENVLPWGHAHGPEPEQLAGPGGWRRGLSAIVAVGIRPCSGAIIILVFALAQGLFWAGVASTFVMGLGTAITVGTIASLAVGARSLAKRLATTRVGFGALALRGLEVAAAGLVIFVGVALLTGYMATEQLGFF